MKTNVTASIVLYKNDILTLENAIKSLLKYNNVDKLFLVDNSPTDDLKTIVRDNRIEYIHNPANPGFGSSHNVAINKSADLGSIRHFVVNPDVYIEEDVVSAMLEYMNKDETIGMMMPKVLNLDKTVQHLPKLLPNPFSILWRKLKWPSKAFEKFITLYELRDIDENKIYNAPILSGCFTLLNIEAVKKVGVYDDKFFMYFEDWDLSRRIHKFYKTLYFPKVSIVHEYESGANKNSKLFKVFVKSAITYFNKWGWFFDVDREKINSSALKQLE